VAALGGQAAIETLRKLECDERLSGGDELEIRPIEITGVFHEDIIDHFQSGVQQLLETIARNYWIIISYGADDSSDSGLDYGIGTGWRFAMMGARFKRGDNGGLTSLSTGTPDGLDFGVRQACFAVVSAADNLSILNNDGADRRVRRGISQSLLRQAERHLHHSFEICHKEFLGFAGFYLAADEGVCLPVEPAIKKTPSFGVLLGKT
jgi:hypothetical protein